MTTQVTAQRALLPVQTWTRRRARFHVPWVAVAVVAVAAMLFVGPILWLLLTSFKESVLTFQIPPAWIFRPTLVHYLNVFGVATRIQSLWQAGQIPNFFGALRNSTVIALGSTLVSTVLGTLAAFGFARFRFRWDNALLVGYLTIRMVPAIAIVIPLFLIYRKIGLYDTYLGMILAHSTFQLPFVVWMMTGFIRQIPSDLELSAMVDGATRVEAFGRVTLPLVFSGIFATTVFDFVQSWNDFVFALLLTSGRTQTLPVAILGFITDQTIFWGEMAAAGILILIPIIAFSIILQRYVVEGATMGAVKG